MTMLLTAEPQLFVRDVAIATEFYTQKLGFSLAFSYGEPPFYGQVFRDGARLNLRHVDNGVVDPVRRDTEQLLAASIALDDANLMPRVRFLHEPGEVEAAGSPADADDAHHENFGARFATKAS